MAQRRRDEHGSPSSPSPRSPERERLHASFLEDRHYLGRMVGQARTERQARVDTVLALKASIEQSSSQIQSRNAQVARRKEARAELEAVSFDELLQQGKNPYEVARRRRVVAAAKAERQQIEEHIEEKQQQLLRRLDAEKAWVAKREKLNDEQRAYERRYQREMGRAAVEARTTQYLVARTGKETLDPTGKAFRLFPSQETSVIPDRSFGLGRNLVHDAGQRHEIVENVRRKPAHRNAAAPSPMLLPRLGRQPSNNEDSDAQNHEAVAEASAQRERPSSQAHAPVRPTSQPTPGQELQHVNHTGLPPPAELREPGGHRGGRPRPSLPPLSSKSEPRAVLGKPKRSVLEERLLAEARERQKANIFTEQIVWGKPFTGQAFLADPPELWFRDFDVGSPMTLSFTLTNVSNTFNHFRLLELDPAIRELFEVTYDKPGRMSAGMSCRVVVVFTATQARDLHGALPAIAQTGAFEIPLRCTCKKSVPVLQQREILFRDVVAGETRTVALTLENAGALPLEYQISSLVHLPESAGSRALTPATDVATGSTASVSDGDVADEHEDLEAQQRQEELLMMDDARSDDPSTSSESAAPPDDGEVQAPASVVALDAADCSVDPQQEQESEAPSEGPDPRQQQRALASQRVPLSEGEAQLVEHVRSTVMTYRPERSEDTDTPSGGPPVRWSSSTGVVAPYSTAALSFTFAPLAPLELEHPAAFELSFPALSTTHRRAQWARSCLAPLTLSLSAHATDVPIFLADDALDFACCVAARLYRQQLVIRNRGKVALQVHLRVPKCLDGCLEFHPSMGFVQGATSSGPGTFPVQVKFRPPSLANDQVWRRLARKRWGDAALGFLAVPVPIVVPDQVIPVHVLVVARVTASALSFSSLLLDFGACVLGHSSEHEVTVTNTSRLAQRVALVKLPSELRVVDTSGDGATPELDGDGMGFVLLPLASRVLRVVYQPNATTTLDAQLHVRTSRLEEYAIRVKGECVAWPVTFSQTVVRLGATQLGQRQTYSVTCRNTSADKPQDVELVVPPEAAAWLRVTPSVATLAPRDSVRVEIEFTAKDELFQLTRSCNFPSADGDATGPSKRTAVPWSVEAQPSADADVQVSALARIALGPLVDDRARGPSWGKQAVISAEPPSVHHTWTVLAFRRSSSASPDEAAVAVALQVQTTVIQPRLEPTPRALDFGQVAIGQALVRELQLTNRHRSQPVELRAKPLHTLGAFRLINSLAMRELGPNGGLHSVKVEFRPTAPLRYDDELEMASAVVGTIRVPLRGEGINPSLVVTPPDGVLDFRDVLAKNRATMDLVLTNASAFPLTYTIVSLDDTVVRTTTALPVFSFSPNEATIAAQGTVTVKVLFTPDRQRPEHYRGQYLIKVPNESERHVVSTVGRCWENQVYLFSPMALPADGSPQHQQQLVSAPPTEDMFDVPPNLSLGSLLSSAMAAMALPGIKRPPSTIAVVFDQQQGSETKTLFVGSTAPPEGTNDDTAAAGAKAGAPAGSFEFAIEVNPEKPHYAKLFTIEPSRGAVNTLQQVPIQITYNASANSPGNDESSSNDGGHPELVVSQWIQVKATCTLKGGALWRPLSATAGAAPGAGTTAAPSAGAKAPAPAAVNANASSSSSADVDSRVVQVVLRARLQTH
ncbi:hypothetical protein P43SY_001863 [Pythium insidiosum]|uniref:MSP domain-containing protein n=1 Tax=Pythium insidiosum TaxID=114742 RepID=A0AAD5LZX5_PYTIN|nr:hypothetical protein P43SY_001863 [Pythium insidiosum]